MPKALSIFLKIGIFVFLNFIANVIILTYRNYAEVLFLLPVLYGFLIGILLFNRIIDKLGYAFLLSLIFWLVFFASSTLGIGLSKSIFQTDDYFPFFSSTFSGFAIVGTVYICRPFKRILLTIFLFSICGILSTYGGSLLMENKESFTLIEKSVYNISFLWQASTGTVLLIMADNFFADQKPPIWSWFNLYKL